MRKSKLHFRFIFAVILLAGFGGQFELPNAGAAPCPPPCNCSAR